MTTSNPIWPPVEIKDTDIRDLIPQRDPILLVDRLLRVEGDVAEACFTVRADLFFLDDDGLLAETGLMEHIAQSASAFAGWRARQSGAETPPVGFIGEVKKFRCHRRPAVGEELRTTITLLTEFDGILVVGAETQAGGEVVAETQMKVAME